MAERRLFTAGAGLLLAALVAGCATIPTSGPVIAGDPVQQPAKPPAVRLIAAPPQPGDDPAGIVDGFVDAMASYAPGYETAKQFLTPEAAAAWDPSAAITVHLGAKPSIEVADDRHVELSMTVSGSVGADGAYTRTTGGQPQQITITMEQVEGEWRIADPPAGVVISEFSFTREFEPHNLYYFDPGFSILVPDPVYLPRYGQTTTLLAQALLRGPTDWLAPAVRTAFPEGVELGVSSVPVESGTATVELTAEARAARPEQRELMAAQLAWTLAEVPDVAEVEITSEGIPLPPGGGSISTTNAFPSFDPSMLPVDVTLYAMTDGGVVTVGAEGDTEPVAGPLGTMDDAREVAVNTGGNRGVVVDDTGHELRVSTFGHDENVESFAVGTDLVAPAWDRTGLIWAVDRDSVGAPVVAMRSDGQAVPVRATGLEGRDVDRMAVSLDGTRIAIVVDDRAYIGVVIRGVDLADGIQIDRLRPIGPDDTAIDVAWTSPTSVAVLTENDDGEREPYVMEISGSVEAARGAVKDAEALAGGPNQQLVVGTGDGTLLTQETSARWIEVGQARRPAYPG